MYYRVKIIEIIKYILLKMQEIAERNRNKIIRAILLRLVKQLIEIRTAKDSLITLWIPLQIASDSLYLIV